MPESYDESPRERARACAYCNKSKTKCIWPQEAGIGSCQRCTRLNRACLLPEVGERRKRGPSTRVGQLESKIDGIMSLLHASRQIQNQQTPPPASSQSPHNSISAPVQPACESAQREPAESGPSSSRPSLPPLSSVAAHPYVTSTSALETIKIVPNFAITYEEADRLLDLYRTSYSPHFPFVPIPPNVSSMDFLEQRPILFKTIIQAVAPQSAAVQRDVSRWFREQIGHHMLVNQERRLELLQSLLVFLAWGNFHFYVDSQGTSLIQLAVGIVIDLGLHRSWKASAYIPNHMIDEARRREGPRVKPQHTLEDMRAFLGCFYVASVVSNLFRKLHMFPYTGYITTCCNAVTDAQEYESDRLVAGLIPIQRVMCKAYEMFPNPDVDDSKPVEFSGALHMAMITLCNELEVIRRNLPIDIQTNPIFSATYCCARMRLYEPVIYMQPGISVGGSMVGLGGSRTEALWSCLEALRLFVQAFTSVPLSILSHTPLPIYSAHAFGIVTMTRILFLHSPDWDLEMARRQFDLPDVAQRLSDVMDAADQLSAREEWKRKRKYVDDTRSVLSMQRDKLHWIRSWYLSKLMPGGQPPNGLNQDLGVDAMQLDRANVPSPGSFDDSFFWETILDLDGTIGPVGVENGNGGQI